MRGPGPPHPEGPVPLSPVIRSRMQQQRRRDTVPELAIRSAAWRLGLRYRVHLSPLPGVRRRADLIFPTERVAVYVDGCFWHVCPIHGTLPRNNRDWWAAKLEANSRRDADTDSCLRAAGWMPLRFWEHEDASEAAQAIATAVKSRGSTHR
jgi:DNA mismatch endonuclease (patch repair protein)